jgi:hypothetical protein
MQNCYGGGILAGMPDNIYRVVPQKNRLFSVEITRPNGKRRLIPDFADPKEAEAWIIQIKRARHLIDPTLTLPVRRSGGTGQAA